MFLMILEKKHSTFPSVMNLKNKKTKKKEKQILVAQNLKQTVAYVTKLNDLKYFVLNHAAHTLLIYE